MQKASEALHNSSPCHTGAIGWRDSKVGMHLFIVPSTTAALSSLKCCSGAHLDAGARRIWEEAYEQLQMEKGVCNLVQKYSPQLIAQRALNSPASLFRIGVSTKAVACLHACWAKCSCSRVWGALMPSAAHPVRVTVHRDCCTAAPDAGLGWLSTFLLTNLLLLMAWMLRRVLDALFSHQAAGMRGQPYIQPHNGLVPAAGPRS